MSGSELSRVRTELDQLRIVPTVAPHPIQPNREFPGHGCLGYVLVSSHRQVHIATPPVRITSRGCLCCFHQQEAQQHIALLTEMSQSLLAGTGVLTRDESNVATDLLATGKPIRRPNDLNVSYPGDRSHPGMGHQPPHLGPL